MNPYNLSTNATNSPTNVFGNNSTYVQTSPVYWSTATDNADVDLNETSIPMPSAPSEPASFEVIVLLSMLFIIIGTVGLVGNSLVIIVIILDRKMRQSMTNIFIMNLAIADFIIMLAGVPEIVVFMMNKGWLLGTAMCKINRFALVVCLYVSILSLVSVCIERFVAIVYPLKAHILCGKRKIIYAVLMIWPMSIGFGLPTAVFNSADFVHPSVPFKYCLIQFKDRRGLQIYKFFEFALFYFIPSVVQIILYAVIGRKLYASTEELHALFQMRKDSKFKPDKSSDTIKARKDVVKMLAASVIVYIICYAPPQVLLFYDTFSPTPFEMTWSYTVFAIVVANINSAANPVLYSIFSQNFRKNFKKYLCFVCLPKKKEYQRTAQDSSESRILSRKISSTSRATVFSRM